MTADKGSEFVRVPVEPTEEMLRPFHGCPPEELALAWEAACMIGKKFAAPAPQPVQGEGEGKWKAIIAGWQARAEAAGYEGVDGVLEAVAPAPAPAESQPQGVEAVTWRVRPHDTDISAARVINDARLAESMAAHRWLVEPLTELPTPAESQPQGVEAVGYVDGSRLHELRDGRLNIALWNERSGKADTPLYLHPAVQIAAPDHFADVRKMVAAPGDVERDVRCIISDVQSARDRMMTAIPMWAGDGFDGDFDSMLEAINALKRYAAALRSQGQAADDMGNPAWWRGHDEACTILCQKVNAILDCKDDGRGVANDPWESTRRRLLALVAAPGDVEQRALAILAATMGRTPEQMGYAEPDAYVSETDAIHAISAALRSQGQAVAVDAKDAARYRWLRAYYGSVNFDPIDHDGMDLVFSVPQGEVSANCDKTIDGLAALAQQANKEQPPNG